MYLQFEWDPKKASLNKIKHGITFVQAITAFDDPDAVEFNDSEHSEDEERFKLIGQSDIGILLIVYTVHQDRHVYRIINARKVTQRERRDYYGQKRKDRS